MVKGMVSESAMWPFEASRPYVLRDTGDGNASLYKQRYYDITAIQSLLSSLILTLYKVNLHSQQLVVQVFFNYCRGTH
jgi:hypothetical protein